MLWKIFIGITIIRITSTFAFNPFRSSLLKRKSQLLSLGQVTMDIEDIANSFGPSIKQASSAKHRVESYLENNHEFKSTFRHSLISWYLENRRRMPWRGDDTNIAVSPYGVWISEVMLQQTRVETVIAYWNRWMSKYPTVESLSRASPDEVNSLWSGLGYYRRAQNLLLGAKFIMDKCNGIIPSSKKQLLEVPGIGPYTAGAILSIAYQQCEPLVDGNVLRVFSRLFCLQEELGGTGSPLEKLCWKVAESLIVEEKQPHDYNQALMELGATICKPTNPDCTKCPVRNFCKGRELADLKASNPNKYQLLPDEVTYFPLKKPKKKQKEVRLLVYVMINEQIQADGKTMRKYLLLKRPEKGLLANQWEFPNLSIDTSTEDKEEDEEEVEEDEKNINVKVQFDFSTMLEKYRDPMINYFQQRCSAHILISDEESKQSNNSKETDYVQASVRYIFEPKRNSFINDPIVHIFSHERHTMHIHISQINLIVLDESKLSFDQCWKTAEEMKETGITTGCKKILEKVEKELSVKIEGKDNGGGKKRKFQPSEEIEVVSSTSNAFELMRKASASKSETGKKKAKKI